MSPVIAIPVLVVGVAFVALRKPIGRGLADKGIGVGFDPRRVPDARENSVLYGVVGVFLVTMSCIVLVRWII